jgi:hypothetical protein
MMENKKLLSSLRQILLRRTCSRLHICVILYNSLPFIQTLKLDFLLKQGLKG